MYFQTISCLSKIKYIKIQLLTTAQWNQNVLFAADCETKKQYYERQSSLELHAFSSVSPNPGRSYQMGHSFRTLDPYLIYTHRKEKMN